MVPSSRPSTASKRNQPMPIDAQALGDIHKVLLGHEGRDIPTPWCCGFTFREAGLRCGLRQREGGPCGVLAAVQAYVLKEVLIRSEGTVDFSAVSPQAAGEALVAALAHIIWSARVGRVASVASCKSSQLPPLRAAAGEIIVTSCGSQVDVATAVRNSIGVYKADGGPGVPLLLYSLTLTRGIAMIGRDADFPTPLIMSNGYCSQELVNLVLIGRGHSNVFDGERSVGGTDDANRSEDGCRLRGVPRRSNVGFLTLFERQGYGSTDGAMLTVGSHYKRPSYPVFVVQSESHYSCLWAASSEAPPDIHEDGELLPGDRRLQPDDEDYEEDCKVPPQLPDGAGFDLFYFDQMAERDDAVRFTLRRAPDPRSVGRDAAPLESVILTRWPAAAVDWNGEEVML